MENIRILLLLTSMLFFSCQKNNLKSIEINYFGQKIPAEKAEVFAPGVISLEGRWEGNANFSIDGKEFYFNVFTDSMKSKSIYWSQYKEKKWSEPEELKEIGNYDNWEPFINYSGEELFFVSSRPPGQEEWNGRIWKSIKNDNNTWTQPELVDIGYETNNGFWFPNHSQLKSNILYFGGNIESLKGIGKGDLYYKNIAKDTVINLEKLNSVEEDWDPFISPDESYLLWASEREGGYGGTDIYVSFKIKNNWSEPINLGKEVNSSGYDVAPRISSDGKILFFDRPKNGSQNIFWISSSIIEKLKNEL